MSLTDVVQSEVQAPPTEHRGHGSGALTVSVRAIFAAVSGLLLTAGIGVVLWAVTPSSMGGPQQSLRAAVAAFAAGNAMTLTIGRAVLTLPPLMITVVAIGLLTGISGRGRAQADDRTGELTRTAAAAAVYAAVVTTAGVVLGTPGAVAAEQWWRPFLLALVVVGTAVFFRGHAWRAVVLARTPLWFPVAARLGAAGAAGIVAAGAAAVVLGLGGSFADSSTVQTLAAPGPAAGFGMALLGIAYLPNAVLAGAGYATGVGFHIGAGSYSPFGSSPVELPAVSLLAAAPDGREASRAGIVLLLIPLVVAVLLGRTATRRLDSRRERVFAVGTGAVFAGLLVAVLAVVAGGGITGGQWATIGAPPLLLGMATAVLLGVLGVAVAVTARQAAGAEAGAEPGAVSATDDPAAGDDPVAVAVEKPGRTADGTPEPVAASAPTDQPDVEPVDAQLTAVPAADETDQTNKTDDIGEVDEDAEIDETHEVDATDQVDKTHEVDETDQVDESDEISETGQAEAAQPDTPIDQVMRDGHSSDALSDAAAPVVPPEAGEAPEAPGSDGASESDEASESDNVPVSDQAPGFDEAPESDQAPGFDEAPGFDRAPGSDEAPESGGIETSAIDRSAPGSGLRV